MKRLFTLLLIAFSVLSCEMIDEKLDDLLDKRDWVVFADGTELTVDVPSKQTVLNYKFESTLDWELTTESEWLEIDPTSGKAGKDIKIKIKVSKNKDKEGRTGYVDLTLSNDESYRITVNQAGEGEENDEGDENEGTIVDVPANQIWYTSTDGEIVEPYSGEYNEYAEAITTFGVNIVSNTYVDGKGVIEFDGDVTKIGEYAFWACSSLVSVMIPDSVNAVGILAFTACENLYKFMSKFASEDGRCLIVDGVLNSFAPAGLTEYAISENVTEIGERAFSHCSNLTNVTIPDSVTTIGVWSFGFCTSLPSITIPDSVTSIKGGAFAQCYGLTNVNIPDGVKEIEDWGFFNCISLTSITIPDSVTTIGELTFYNCDSLTSVTIPDSVTTIGGDAFNNCYSLNAVYITDLSAWCRIDFSNKESNPLTFAHNLYLNNELVTDLTIPSDITVIKDYAFFSGNSILNINLHNGITSVGVGAFVGCGIPGITIPDSITEIKDAAFTQCPYLAEFRGKFATEDGLALIVDGRFHAFANGSGIAEYAIPEGVVAIGGCAFNKAYSLESVTIPSSVNQIGDNAFWHTPNLKRVYCKSAIPPYLGKNILGDDNNINASYCKIYVPAESCQDYISAEGWSQYAASILPYDYDNNCVVEVNASEETKRWLGKWSSTVSRTYCPQTGFNEEAVTFEVNIEHNAVAPNFVKVYGLSVIDPTIAVDGVVNANGDLEILNFNYIGNSGEWGLYVWALSEAMSLSFDRHAVYTMSMDESGHVSCEVSSLEGSPYIMFDIFAYNHGNGSVSWYDSSLSYYSGPMSWVKIADNGATPSRYSQKVPYITNFRPQADAKLKVVE